MGRFFIAAFMVVGAYSFFNQVTCQEQVPCCQSKHEHFIPVFSDQESWRLKVAKSRENGSYTAIWFKEDVANEQERVVIVASVFEEVEPCFEEALQSFLAPIKDQMGIKCEIYERYENEAIVGWQREGDELCCVRILITPSALHFLSYSYRGICPEQIDVHAVIAFLKQAYLDADGAIK